jgi:hypothetical protein
MSRCRLQSGSGLPAEVTSRNFCVLLVASTLQCDSGLLVGVIKPDKYDVIGQFVLQCVSGFLAEVKIQEVNWLPASSEPSRIRNSSACLGRFAAKNGRTIVSNDALVSSPSNRSLVMAKMQESSSDLRASAKPGARSVLLYCSTTA